MGWVVVDRSVGAGGWVVGGLILTRRRPITPQTVIAFCIGSQLLGSVAGGSVVRRSGSEQHFPMSCIMFDLCLAFALLVAGTRSSTDVRLVDGAGGLASVGPLANQNRRRLWNCVWCKRYRCRCRPTFIAHVLAYLASLAWECLH